MKVFWKKLFYLYEIMVKFEYILPFSNPTSGSILFFYNFEGILIIDVKFNSNIKKSRESNIIMLVFAYIVLKLKLRGNDYS